MITRALALSFATLLVGPHAHAGSTAGIGLAPEGGPLSRITRGDAGALFHTPTGGQGGTHLWLDMGALHWASTTTLDGEAPAEGAGWFPLMGVAFSTPLSEEMSVGFHLGMPFGGGGVFPEDGAQRFHVIDGKAMAIEEGLGLSWAPGGPLVLGGSVRAIEGYMAQTRAFDTGTMLADMVGTGAGVPLDDPFLEGRQTMAIMGVGLGWAVGADLRFDKLILSAAHRSAARVPLHGDFTLIPSLDMTFEMAGAIDTEMAIPATTQAGISLDLGKAWLHLDGGTVNWTPFALWEGTMSDVEVTSSDPQMDAVLAQFGINDVAILTEPQAFTMAFGHGRSWHGGVAIELPVNETVDLQLNAHHSTAAVPDAYIHASNQDYATTRVGQAWTWKTPGRWSVALTHQAFLDADRVTTDSAYNPANEMLSGTAVRSSNGIQGLDRQRFTLTLQWK
jgi:hypothetical protein